jgi:hypothetical protein
LELLLSFFLVFGDVFFICVYMCLLALVCVSVCVHVFASFGVCVHVFSGAAGVCVFNQVFIFYFLAANCL